MVLSKCMWCAGLLLENIFIQFGTKLYRQVVGIPMGTYCAPLVADLFLCCRERDFMISLSDDKQADIIDAFNTTSRYLDDILNINNVYFDTMVSQIYHSELQLNKAHTSDTEAAFLDLHLSIFNYIVFTKIYDKRDDFDFEIVNFPFLNGDVPRSTSYGVYISQLVRFVRASSHVAGFNTRNKLLTQKLLKQGYQYHKLRKTFSKFYRRYYDLISKLQIRLISLLRQGLAEPEFYGDLVYKLKKIVGSNNFSTQFIKIISHYKKIGYNIDVLQQIDWWLTQLRLATLLSSLIARRWIGLQTLWWFRLKDVSIDQMVGADALLLLIHKIADLVRNFTNLCNTGKHSNQS